MGYRWRGFEHPKLYEMINAGPGAAASDPQTTYWQGLSEELSAVDQDLNTSLNNMGARWEGKAAQSAQSGLTPLAEWASDAETGSNVMKISSENQGEYISDARARMPKPVEVTTQAPSGWSMVTAGAALLTGNPGPAAQVAAQAADHELQEAAQSEAEQRAVETMQTYESSSTWNRDTLGTFVKPPDVVVATPAPQGGSATAVIIGANRNYTPNGNTGSNSSGTKKNPQVVTGGVPDNGDPGQDTGGGGNGGGGNNGGGSNGGGGNGGGVFTPTVPPGTTTPSDVFVPPPGGGPLPPGQNPFPPGLPPGPGPGPNPPGPNPFIPPGAGPFPPGLGDTSNNAGDVARRALQPLRPGMPVPGVPGEPFGPGRGMPGGPGGFGGPGGGLAGAIDGERAPSQLGRGGVLGAPGEGGVVRNGPGAAGAAGARGGVNGPMGAGGRRADGEEDDEHFSPDYLLETDDVFGDERRVSPTVIGEQ